MIDPAQLTQNLGGKWYGQYGTGPCPCCQPERRIDQHALVIRAEYDRLLLHCKKFGCDFRDILVAAGIRPGHIEIDRMVALKVEQERRKKDVKKRAKARELWRSSRSLENTPGEAYLRGRGITCVLPAALRWLPDAYHAPSQSSCPAMVANISTGGIHRTFFDRQTGARLTTTAKMMLGPCSGGAVVLQEARGPLVVCEGIETGLSLASGLLSGPATIWAALSSSGIRGLQLPDQSNELIVATDGDPVGRKAGDALKSRALAIGWDVSLLPAPFGHDWNDVLTGKATTA